MKWLWLVYLFCAVFGVYAFNKAGELIGPYPITDGRHSMSFYMWEMGAGLFLLIAAIGFFLYLFDVAINKD